MDNVPVDISNMEREVHEAGHLVDKLKHRLLRIPNTQLSQVLGKPVTTTDRKGTYCDASYVVTDACAWRPHCMYMYFPVLISVGCFTINKKEFPRTLGDLLDLA